MKFHKATVQVADWRDHCPWATQKLEQAGLPWVSIRWINIVSSSRGFVRVTIFGTDNSTLKHIKKSFITPFDELDISY